jgi:hypothetical protein
VQPHNYITSVHQVDAGNLYSISGLLGQFNAKHVTAETAFIASIRAIRTYKTILKISVGGGGGGRGERDMFWCGEVWKPVATLNFTDNCTFLTHETHFLRFSFWKVKQILQCGFFCHQKNETTFSFSFSDTSFPHPALYFVSRQLAASIISSQEFPFHASPVTYTGYRMFNSQNPPYQNTVLQGCPIHFTLIVPFEKTNSIQLRL